MTWYKVTIDGTDYEEEFIDIQVTGRECDIAGAILIADNKQGSFWTDTVDLFDSVTIQMRQLGVGGSLATQFTGTVREVKPYASEGGFYTGIKCNGLGLALTKTHCKDAFGYTSDQPTLDTVEEILEDLVDNSINKSYSSANNTGYAISKDYIPTIDAGLSIPFLNAPYQTCKSIVDLICTLDTAYRAGSTAGPHWYVNSDGDLRVKTIGTQQADGGHGGGAWGTYYNGQAGNSNAKLYEDEDFYSYTLTKPSNQYANNVVLAFDLRKPAYDYWTETNITSLWDDDADATVTEYSGDPVVGSYAMHIASNGTNTGYAWYPASEDAGWDLSKWGSIKTIPTINFYSQMDTDGAHPVVSDIGLFTTDHLTDVYHLLTGDLGDPWDTWVHHSIPVGPYWKSYAESRQLEWAEDGSPDWTDINGIAFKVTGIGGDGYFAVDDLHFAGKCMREAVDTSEVTSYDEQQHTLLSRTPLDDTAVASDDSGMAGQICYAELLRRVTPPRWFTCTVPFKQALKPGEQFTLYAGKDANGNYKLNGVDFRVVEYTHRCTQNNQPETSLTMTDDVKNSFPVGPLNARAILNEYLLVNNEKATDMQGGEVDLLIPHLRKTY